MPYAVISDMSARFANRDLVQLTNEDPSILTINTAFLTTFLNDASDEMDAYFETRFALPLLDPPMILTRICCEIAMYHLNALRPIHDLADAKDKYEKAIKFLVEVSEGKHSLGLTAIAQVPVDSATPPAVVFEQNFNNAFGVPQRVFNRRTLKGF